MDNKKVITEFVIKLVLALFGLVASISLISDCLSMLSLYKSMSMDENEVYTAVFNTHLGSIFKDMGIFETIDKNVVKNALISFVYNLDIFVILFLIFFLVLISYSFMYPKWQLFKSNIIISLGIIGMYFFKYILFGLTFLIFYKDTLTSIALSLIIGTSIYYFCSLIEFALLFLFIIKFVFNLIPDIKKLSSIVN